MSHKRGGGGGVRGGLTFVTKKVVIFFEGFPKVKPKGRLKYFLDRLRSSVGLFHNVLVYMVDLHLVLPALNLSFLFSGILIIEKQ